jgi:hypothetical protein
VRSQTQVLDVERNRHFIFWECYLKCNLQKKGAKFKFVIVVQIRRPRLIHGGAALGFVWESGFSCSPKGIRFNCISGAWEDVGNTAIEQGHSTHVSLEAKKLPFYFTIFEEISAAMPNLILYLGLLYTNT